jgi:hypothetical protein
VLDQLPENVVQLFSARSALAVATAEADPPDGSGHFVESVDDRQGLVHRRQRLRGEDVDVAYGQESF